MKKYSTFYFLFLFIILLFIFSTYKASGETELKSKSNFIEKTYCFLYPSRCVTESLTASTTVATTTKSLETKIEDKGIVTNTMSWIRSLKSNRVETKLLCVEDVCVNKSQFLKMVQTTSNDLPVFTISFTANNGTTTATSGEISQ